MTEPVHDKIKALYFYFLRASTMYEMVKTQSKALSQMPRATPEEAVMASLASHELLRLIEIFYALTFVVAEGMQEAGLNVPELEPFIGSREFPLFKRFRNAVFHYQSEFPVSDKLLEFMDAKDSEKWIKSLWRVLNVWFSKNVALLGFEHFASNLKSGELPSQDDEKMQFMSALLKALEAHQVKKP